VAALESEISKQKDRITGFSTEQLSLNRAGIEYQDLLYEVELSKVIYEASLSSYELARTQASKKLKHLLISSKPTPADEAVLPKRLYWALTWLAIFLCIYGVCVMALSSIQEHRD